MKQEFNRKLISIVAPAFREEVVLPSFYEELAGVFRTLSNLYDWEIIFVDDGSTDRTLDVLKELRSKDRHVKWLSLSRNFGHQAALTAGLEHAKGDAVITMDSDLQHPVVILKEFLEKWEEGFEIVCGVRKRDFNQDVFKRFTSVVFYRLINLMSKVSIRVDAPDFRLMSRKALNAFLRFGEGQRFLRGMVSWMGFRTCEVEFRTDSRRAGATKYSLRRMVSFALEGLTSFSSIPLRISALVGVLICFSSFLYACRIFYIWLVRPETLQKGWASLLISIHFLCGMILIFMGIVGEYIGRIYQEVKKRPIYLVEDKDGFE